MAARRQAPAPASGRPLDRAQDLSIETMGRMAEFWGFTRTQGRVFCLLFLSARPVTQAELAEALDAARGRWRLLLADRG